MKVLKNLALQKNIKDNWGTWETAQLFCESILLDVEPPGSRGPYRVLIFIAYEEDFKLDITGMQHVTYVQTIVEDEFIIGLLLDSTKPGNNTKNMIE